MQLELECESSAPITIDPAVQYRCTISSTIAAWFQTFHLVPTEQPPREPECHGLEIHATRNAGTHIVVRGTFYVS